MGGWVGGHGWAGGVGYGLVCYMCRRAGRPHRAAAQAGISNAPAMQQHRPAPSHLLHPPGVGPRAWRGLPGKKDIAGVCQLGVHCIHAFIFEIGGHALIHRQQAPVGLGDEVAKPAGEHTGAELGVNGAGWGTEGRHTPAGSYQLWPPWRQTCRQTRLSQADKSSA
jgi:hypothetical protein